MDTSIITQESTALKYFKDRRINHFDHIISRKKSLPLIDLEGWMIVKITLWVFILYSHTAPGRRGRY